jgi:hypothetical protein
MRTYFAIVGMGRSGSTFLARLLDSHPQITCLEEVFAPTGLYATRGAADPAEFIEHQLFGEATGVLGFKLPWMNMNETPGALDALQALHFRLIFLRRRNQLDRQLSVALAQRNDVWWPQGAYPEQTISLDPQVLLNRFEFTASVDQHYQTICANFPHVAVDYEDLIRGYGQESIQDFLGVERAALRSGIERARRLPRRQAIINFDDLAAFFSDTPWAVFFEDDEHIVEG